MLTPHTPDAHWLAAPPPAPARWAREKSRANGAASWRAPLVEQEQGQDLAVDRAQAMLPGRHLALSSLINRLVDRADVATIDPALVRQVRRAELLAAASRSEEHTSELQSLMRISYAVF